MALSWYQDATDPRCPHDGWFQRFDLRIVGESSGEAACTRTLQERVERSDVDKSLKPIASRLMDIARSSGATAVDPSEYICGETYCPTLADDRMPVYTDESHLRPAFVRDHMTFLDAIVSTSPSKTSSSNLMEYGR